MSDTVVGICLVAVIASYVMVSQAQSTPNEAVLAEISMIMNDLESQLKAVQLPNGHLPQSVSLKEILEKGENTAIMGKAGDPPLWPDITEEEDKKRLGGCPVDENRWVLLRMDHAALTQIPESWDTPVAQVCLDRNGPKGPNQEGYDVIWLSFSRNTSPHITLIPARIEKDLPNTDNS